MGAQSRDELLKARLDSALSERYYKTHYDTNYVVRPPGRLMVRTRVNVSGNSVHSRGDFNGTRYTSDLQTDRKLTLSLGFNYRGLATAVAVNPASLFGKKRDYELNVNVFSSRLSLDASYHNSHTLAGDFHGRQKYHLDRGIIDMKVLNLVLYYTFNHRRFSYPAAFTQSYVQRRSAGSWLAGASFQGGSIKNSKDCPPQLPKVNINADHIGLGAGYGYNFVTGQWLLHFSMLPTVVLYNHNSMTVDDVHRKAEAMKMNMIFNERMAVIYNFPLKGEGKKRSYFAGVTGVMNNSVFDDDVVVINQNKWRFRAFVGVRL